MRGRVRDAAWMERGAPCVSSLPIVCALAPSLGSLAAPLGNLRGIAMEFPARNIG